MIYAFLNQKGGVGKTTLSIHTAAELSNRGRRVLLIDADPQGSSLGWSNHRETSNFTVVGMAKATIHKEIESLAQDYYDVVIDGPRDQMLLGFESKDRQHGNWKGCERGIEGTRRADSKKRCRSTCGLRRECRERNDGSGCKAIESREGNHQICQ